MHRRPKHEWGAHLWAFIHTVTVVDFEDGKNRGFHEKAVEVLRGVQRVIPCEKCRAKYGDALAELDALDLSESMCLFRWSVDLHNAVNRKLGKTCLTYEEAVETWTKEL